MGLLDDAIREHLELKRRHGASDDEISRQEAEALGPARRQAVEPASEDAAPALAEPPLEEPALEEPPLEEPPLEEPAREEPLPDEPAARPLGEGSDDGLGASPGEREPPEPEVDLPLPSAEPPAEPDVGIPDPSGGGVGAVAEEPVREEPVAPRDFTETRVSETPLPATGDDVEDDPASAGLEEDEDLLEETPDFLQDSPEHDQLWFEQKPPRDFDLD